MVVSVWRSVWHVHGLESKLAPVSIRLVSVPLVVQHVRLPPIPRPLLPDSS